MDSSDTYDYTTMSFERPPDTAMLDFQGIAVLDCRNEELLNTADKQYRIGEVVINRYGEAAITVLYLGLYSSLPSANANAIAFRLSARKRGTVAELSIYICVQAWVGGVSLQLG